MKEFKYLFVVLLCICLSQNIFAQYEFAPIGAVWYYSSTENFAGNQGYVKLESMYDTTINNKPSKVLTSLHYSSSGEVLDLENLYVYQNEDTVFYFLDNEFRPTYYFNCNIGDTLEIYSKELFCSENEAHTGHVIVDSIKMEIINDHNLKKYYTSKAPGSPYMINGPYYEVFGGIYGIFPVDTGCVADEFKLMGLFRCYFDTEFGHYQLKNNLSCDSLVIITSIKGIDKNSFVNFIANPIENTISIKSDQQIFQGTISFRIIDISGREIQKNIIQSDIEIINLPQSYKGIFIFQLLLKNTIVSNEKLLFY